MVKKTSKPKATVKTRTVYRTAPRKKRRATNKYGYKDIPGAMATASLVAANIPNIKYFAKNLNGLSNPQVLVNRVKASSFVTPNQLVKDVMYTAAGMIAGEVVKKYAPAVIKKPVGKISKKIPKVI